MSFNYSESVESNYVEKDSCENHPRLTIISAQSDGNVASSVGGDGEKNREGTEEKGCSTKSSFSLTDKPNKSLVSLPSTKGDDLPGNTSAVVSECSASSKENSANVTSDTIYIMAEECGKLNVIISGSFRGDELSAEDVVESQKQRLIESHLRGELNNELNAVNQELLGGQRVDEGVQVISVNKLTSECHYQSTDDPTIGSLSNDVIKEHGGSLEAHPGTIARQQNDTQGVLNVVSVVVEDSYSCVSNGIDNQAVQVSSNLGNVMAHTLKLLPQQSTRQAKVYACSFCSKTFSQPHQLVRHERMHTGEKPFVCDVCGKGCSQKGDLVRHKRKHTGERPYKCDLCDKAYFKSADLKYHKRKHSGEKPYKCTICEKAFTGLTTLRYHNRTHTGERPYSCEECGKKFSQSSSLRIHKETHAGFKSKQKQKHGSDPMCTSHKLYQCEVCNKSLAHLSSLICHKRTHTGEKPYKCDQCDKAYSQSFDLKRHKETHSGFKSFKCDTCDKAFHWATNLREHKKQHTTEKPFKCDVCDKSFAWSSALGQHKRRHNKAEKPFKCETCGKTYAAMGYLNQHKAIKHMNKEEPKICLAEGASPAGEKEAEEHLTRGE